MKELWAREDELDLAEFLKAVRVQWELPDILARSVLRFGLVS